MGRFAATKARKNDVVLDGVAEAIGQEPASLKDWRVEMPQRSRDASGASIFHQSLKLSLDSVTRLSHSRRDTTRARHALWQHVETTD